MMSDEHHPLRNESKTPDGGFALALAALPMQILALIQPNRTNPIHINDLIVTDRLNIYGLAAQLQPHVKSPISLELLQVAVNRTLEMLFYEGYLAFVPKRYNPSRFKYKFPIITRRTAKHHHITHKKLLDLYSELERLAPDFDFVSPNTVEPLLTVAINNGYDIILQQDAATFKTTYSYDYLATSQYHYRKYSGKRKGFSKYFSYYAHNRSRGTRSLQDLYKKTPCIGEGNDTNPCNTYGEIDSTQDLALLKLRRQTTPKRNSGQGYALQGCCQTPLEIKANLALERAVKARYRDEGLKAPPLGGAKNWRYKGRVLMPKSIVDSNVPYIDPILIEDEVEANGNINKIKTLQKGTYYSHKHKKNINAIYCYVDPEYFQKVVEFNVRFGPQWEKPSNGCRGWHEVLKNPNEITSAFYAMSKQYEKAMRSKYVPQETKTNGNSTVTAKTALDGVMGKWSTTQTLDHSRIPKILPAQQLGPLNEHYFASLTHDPQTEAAIKSGLRLDTGLLDIIPQLLTPKWLWAILDIHRDVSTSTVLKFPTSAQVYVLDEKASGFIRVERRDLNEVLVEAVHERKKPPEDVELLNAKRIHLDRISMDELAVLKTAKIEAENYDRRLNSIKAMEKFDADKEANQTEIDVAHWLEANFKKMIDGSPIVNMTLGSLLGHC